MRTEVRASALRPLDRVADEARAAGRVVRRVRKLRNGRIRIRWSNGWDETFAPDQTFVLLERGVPILRG